jgi:hypothetical protein
VWGRSSAGRAPALQAGGRRFDPDRLHHHRLSSNDAHVSTIARRQSFACKRMKAGSRVPGVRVFLESSAGEAISCIAECPNSVRSCVWAKRPRSCGRVVCAARLGGVVLCQGESGSGASLGACDQSQSVGDHGAAAVLSFGRMSDRELLFVRLNAMHSGKRTAPQRSAARVQRRVNDPIGSAVQVALRKQQTRALIGQDPVVCGVNTYFQDHPKGSPQTNAGDGFCAWWMPVFGE